LETVLSRALLVREGMVSTPSNLSQVMACMRIRLFWSNRSRRLSKRFTDHWKTSGDYQSQHVIGFDPIAARGAVTPHPLKSKWAIAGAALDDFSKR
jgi:hypothetical protein